jgi:hypothetical protein
MKIIFLLTRKNLFNRVRSNLFNDSINIAKKRFYSHQIQLIKNNSDLIEEFEKYSKDGDVKKFSIKLQYYSNQRKILLDDPFVNIMQNLSAKLIEVEEVLNWLECLHCMEINIDNNNHKILYTQLIEQFLSTKNLNPKQFCSFLLSLNMFNLLWTDLNEQLQNNVINILESISNDMNAQQQLNSLYFLLNMKLNFNAINKSLLSKLLSNLNNNLITTSNKKLFNIKDCYFFFKTLIYINAYNFKSLDKRVKEELKDLMQSMHQVVFKLQFQNSNDSIFFSPGKVIIIIKIFIVFVSLLLLLFLFNLNNNCNLYMFYVI